MSITEGFDTIQCLIHEYETKYDHPTIEGFSMFLERRKQYLIQQYKERQDKKRVAP
jgi:hypothetical protein